MALTYSWLKMTSWRWSYMQKWLATLSFMWRANWYSYNAMWSSTVYVMGELPSDKIASHLLEKWTAMLRHVTPNYSNLQETSLVSVHKSKQVTVINLKQLWKALLAMKVFDYSHLPHRFAVLKKAVHKSEQEQEIMTYAFARKEADSEVLA